MRKLKHILAFALCCALAVGAYAFGAGDTPPSAQEEEAALGEILIEMANQISSLQTRAYALEARLGALQNSLSQAETDGGLIDAQIAQSRGTEKYLFRTEYNAAALLMEKGGLLARQLKLLDKRIAVERVKAEFGEAAPGSLEALAAQREGISLQIASNRKAWELKKKLIDTKQGEKGYEFIGDYTIPETIPEFTMTPEKLRDALKEKNVSLRSYDNQLKSLNDALEEIEGAYGYTYDTHSIEAEIRGLGAQRELYERQLEWTALGKYAAYTDALAVYGAHSARRPLLREQLGQIEAMRSAGELSELECLSRELSIYEELYNADSAAAALDSAVRELEFLADGIAVG